MLEYVDLPIAPTSIPVMACRENEGAEVNSAEDLYIDGSSWANPTAPGLQLSAQT